MRDFQDSDESTVDALSQPMPGYLFDDILDVEDEALQRMDIFDSLPAQSLEVLAMVMAYESRRMRLDLESRVSALDSQAVPKLAAFSGAIHFAERVGRRASKRLLELQGLDTRPPVIHDKESSDHDEPD